MCSRWELWSMDHSSHIHKYTKSLNNNKNLNEGRHKYTMLHMWVCICASFSSVIPGPIRSQVLTAKWALNMTPCPGWLVGRCHGICRWGIFPSCMLHPILMIAACQISQIHMRISIPQDLVWTLYFKTGVWRENYCLNPPLGFQTILLVGSNGQAVFRSHENKNLCAAMKRRQEPL